MENIRHVFLFELKLWYSIPSSAIIDFFLTIVIWSMVWSGPLWGHHSNTHPLTLKDQDTLHFSGIGRYHDLCSSDSLHPPAPEHDTESWVYHSNVMSSRNARYRIASVSQQTLYAATKHGYMMPTFMFKVTKRTWLYPPRRQMALKVTCFHRATITEQELRSESVLKDTTFTLSFYTAVCDIHITCKVKTNEMFWGCPWFIFIISVAFKIRKECSKQNSYVFSINNMAGW